MKLARVIRNLHQVFGLLIGIQILLWTITGVYFNTMDSEVTSGNLTKRASSIIALAPPSDDIFSAILANKTTPIDQQSVTNIALYKVLTTSVIKFSMVNNVQYFSYNNHSFSPLNIDESMAKEIAKQSYNSPIHNLVSIEGVSVLHQANTDLPHNSQRLYKVDFADKWNTRVYVNAKNGTILRHYNDHSWLQDMAFMLHFMDYQRIGSFNHWLIVLSALLSAALVISGLYWLLFLSSKGFYTASKRD